MKNKRIFQCGILAALICILTLCGVLLYQNWKLDNLQQSMLQELDSGEGCYDPQSIVLRDTSKADAEELAELLGAQLRITQDGGFAVLYLPEEMTIRDVVAADENREILSQLSIDYQVQVSELSEENEETGLRLPARPDHTVSDDSYGQQHYLDYLNMGDVWASYTGSGVTVAVIDTGIDTDHPEFAGRISEYSYNATEDKIVKDYQMDWSLIEDEAGHGTAVAGVLAASMNNDGIVGIAPNVEIIVIKAECDENGNFKRSSDLVFALYYAIERDVQVVNMSFGVGQNVFAEAIQLAYDSDVICVASAGNESTAALTYPAADPLVIGVGALESDGWNLADYSNYGENVDIVAPGTTYTAAMGGGYESKHGTSMSAPQVTGAIALFMQNNRYATFDKVTEVLYASGYDLGDLGRDWYYGFGGLDLHAFLMEERGTVTFEMLTDELENDEGLFIRNHTMQELPEPERLYAVFDGWYYDDMFTEEYNYYSDVFTGDLTLYAKWVNEDDGIPYTYVVLDDGTVEIRSYTGHRRFITIPEKIDGRVVSSIGDFAFSGQTRLREITLPNGLTNIGLSAFAGCSNLVTMDIPANVTQLGARSFADNVRLSTLSFAGNKLTSIGEFTFSGCCRLERIELPSGVNSVDGSAFYGTTDMQCITVRGGNAVFTSQDGVLFTADGSQIVAYPAGRDGEYRLPGTCTEIGDYAFACSGLGTIDLKSVSTVGMSAFERAALEILTIPDGVTSIGSGAFAFNVKLTQVQLGNGLTQISGRMFMGCSALQDIHIPAGIQSIDNVAFWLSGLKTVTFDSDSGLENIGGSAFNGCSIETLSIPDSVTAIGARAFYANPLTEVNLSAESRLKSIGMEAFRCCWLLTEIDLPGKLEIIDELAFANTGLTAVTVPASVTVLGDGAFAYCGDLTGVTVEADNSTYHDISGVVYSRDDTLIHTYPAGRTDASYTLEAATTSIGSYAFAGTGYLTTVYLSDVLVDINEYGFDASGIERITIPDSVIRLGRYSFTNCSDLTTVSFNATSNLARIGYGTFVNCGLTKFTVPANVSTMGQQVFVDCDTLTAVTFAANSKLESLTAYIFTGCKNLRSITFLPGSALTSVQAHGLEGMAKLISMDFGDAGVTNIDNFAFRFCTSLSSLKLPETVTNVGRYAFYGCESLSELTLPEYVEHIGGYAFLGTTDLQLYLSADHVPAYLDEDWDRGIAGYYVGVTDVNTSGDYKYATLTSGGIAILEYLGSAESVDLTAVELGAPITAIGGKAFLDSTITSVTLPDSLTEIQAEAFAYTGLTDVTIPANVTFIGREAFVGTDIAALDFASGSELKTIEQRAFADTENLTSVVIPASVTKLGTGVFQSSGLTNVTFADGIQLAEIPQRAFTGTKLESVALPDSVTLVNHNAFNGVSTLQSVTFGNNEGIRLMSNAFYRTGLTSLEIPANVTYIGEFCFVGLENLNDFTVDAENPNYTAEDGLLLSKSGRKLIAVPAGRTGTLTVPVCVEEIGFGALERSSLREVRFDSGANILTLGCRAFFEAENLTKITIPASVVSVDYYAFAYCENLQTVEFADGNQLKGIYEGAFCGDIALENITVPDAIVEISDFAFYGCSKLDALPVEGTAALKGIYDYAFAYTGISGDFTTPENLIDIGNYAFAGIKAEKITVPDTKRKELIIGLGAFEGCNQLTEITLPFIGSSFEDEEITWFGYVFGAGDGLANEIYVPENLRIVTITEGISFIGFNGFRDCSSLETINLPSGIFELYGMAFSGTTASYTLTDPVMTYVTNGEKIVRRGHFGQGIEGEVILAEGITEIEVSAFSWCRRLTGITMPDSIQTVGDSAFSGCSLLKDIVIPEGITEIPDMLFSGCSNLKTIEIPDGVEKIGAYAFNGSGLVEIILPEGVKSIDRAAFGGCSLTQITLPSTLESIGDYAFVPCMNLYEIYNNSALQLSFSDSANHGGVAEYAKVIIDEEGNKTYRDGEEGFAFVDTPDGFRYFDDHGVYRLVAYIGKESTVRLPTSLDGHPYELDNFGGAYTVIIPGEFETVEQYAFDGSNVPHFVLEEGITTIGEFAFSSNRSLKTVVLPDSLKTIGDYAFDNCQSMESINIPRNLTEIGINAFSCCYCLKDIDLPVGIKELKNGVFSWCFDLERITIPDSVTKIGNHTFSRCEKLKEVTMSSNVTSIGAGAFSQCISLEQLNLPESIAYIGEGAFPSTASVSLPDGNEYYRYIDGILYDRDVTTIVFTSESIPADVVLPDTVRNIPSYAFQNNSVIRSIVIPEGITTLGDGVFQGSTLESVELPQGLITVSGSFEDCDNLREVVLPDGLVKLGYDTFRGCRNLQVVEIPDSVTYIGGYAFSGCASLQEITIPHGVQKILVMTFEATGISNIEIPDSVTVIEGHAFGCTNLQEIILPDSVTEIGDAFSSCSSLERVTLSKNLVTIGENAFGNCPNLKYVENRSEFELSFGSTDHGSVALNAAVIIDADGVKHRASEDVDYEMICTDDGFRFVCDSGEYRLVGYVGQEETITLPESVNGHPYELWHFNGGKNIIIPESMTSIPDKAFYRNVVTETIIVSPGMTEISSGAFAGCYALRTIEIPHTVTVLGASAFSGCKSLEEITLPDSLEKIGEGAFNSCRSLREIRLPDGLKEIGAGAFAYCENLNEITIPESLESIGGSAFVECTSLTELNIPTNVTYVGPELLRDTALYNDPSNWTGDMLIVDGWLLDLAEDARYANAGDLIESVACYKSNYNHAWMPDFQRLKCTHWEYKHRLPVNLETLILLDIPEGCDSIDSTLTLRNIVISDKIAAGSIDNCRHIFGYLDGITIFVEADEKDLRWDTNFPGWNNGNKVIYGDNWIWVNFYDDDGTLLQSEPKRTSEVIRRPFVEKQDECYTYELIGWDLDGDGAADVIPATSATDINAVAVYQRTPKMFTITFKDAQSGEIYSQQKLAYGTTITPPADPVKEGRIFEGWSGYSEGMTVIGNLEFTAKWHTHDYQSVVTEPTCVEKGYTTHTCANCGDSYVDTYVDALGHDMGEWTIVTEANCTEDGQELRECVRCDRYETRIIEARGHSYDAAVTKPTCTEQGYTQYVCSVCGDSYISDYVVPTGHDYKTVVTAPTCTEQGYTTYTCHCGDCYVSDYTDPLGHDMGAWETATEAACTENGEEIRECSRCDHSESRDIEAMGHDWNEGIVTVEPTEETVGELTYTCSRCGETKTEVIPELEHEHRYDAVVTAPTCTEQGYTTHTCRCGDSYVDTYVEALGHDMGEWFTVTEATCTADGMEKRDCSRCEYHETQVIEATGHDYESVVTDPTCSAQGFTTHTCHCGDSYIDSYTAALGHSFTTYVSDGNATCTQDGTKTSVCDRCDAVDTVIDKGSAHGHEFTEWTVVQKPTEMAEGLESRYCLNCGLEETRAVACLVNPFGDVPSGSFYYEPVMWAVENGITNGTSATTFDPNDQCMRAHVVTFLWRAVGSPEPTQTDNPFVDVKPSDFYYKSVLWALENGITSGMDATHFGPTSYCNRAQVVTFLYRTMESPEVTSSDNPFTDVPAGQWFTAPVLWAVENGITNGLSATTFGPNTTCNRAQIVTFLYRAFVD